MTTQTKRLTLKTRVITGKLVPLRGEHVEYQDEARAFRDAEVYALVSGEPVYVVNARGDAREVRP